MTQTYEFPAVERTPVVTAGIKPADYIMEMIGKYVKIRQERDEYAKLVDQREAMMIETENEIMAALKDGIKIDPRVNVLKDAIYNTFGSLDAQIPVER